MSKYDVRVYPKNFREITKKDFKSSQRWYVYVVDQDGKRKKFKKDINKIHNLEERKLEIAALQRAIELKIAALWNPFTGQYDDPRQTDEAEAIMRLPICDALDLALKKKSLAPKSRSGYTAAVRYFTEAAKRLNYNKMLPRDMRRLHVALIMENYQKHEKDSDKSYNKYLGFIKALFTVIEAWGLVEVSVARPIPYKAVSDQEPRKQPTPEEKKVIHDYFYVMNPHFLNYFLGLYHTGARPCEVLAMKIKYINLRSLAITFPAEITKGKKTSKVLAITPELRRVLEGMKLHLYDPEWYVFGSPYEGGKGARGGPAWNLGPMYSPNPNKVSVDTATKYWKEHVKDKLGIDVDHYALKGLGGNDRAEANIDPLANQNQFGHATLDMSIRYSPKIKEVLRRQIADKSPDFLADAPG